MRTLQFFDLRHPVDHPDPKLAGRWMQREWTCECGSKFTQTYANKSAIEKLPVVLKRMLAASIAKDGEMIVWPSECTRCLRRKNNDPRTRTR